MSNQKPSNQKPANPRPPIDPLVAKRLQAMNARNRTGSALPPPKPGTARPSAPAAAAPAASTAAAPTSVSAEQAAKLEAAAARAAAARAAKQGGPTVRTAANPGRRAKPARASKVGALALSVATTAGLTAMFAGQDTGTTDSVVLTGGTLATVAPTATTAATATSEAVTTTAGDTLTSAEPTTTVTVAAAPATILDGTYVGAADSNRWGVVQVQAVYSGGQLVDVQILQYPDGDNKSVRINQRSLPTLISEAISNQSADVNTVSGATYTSNSYKASLQSAIDAAKAASGIAG
ncbi:MAG: hypothetical protein RL238_2832 [Actinomycetota bacterium]|jgi:uncharacterized protein with FMN-binding domain